MPHMSIRVVFVLKNKPLRARRKALGARSADELMGGLRAVPRQASLARAQRALGDHYAVELASDGSDLVHAQIPGLRLVIIELTARHPGIGFREACLAAMKAMCLSAEVVDGSREPLLVDMRPLPDAEPPAFDGGMGTLQERLDWFSARLASLLWATSADFERAALLGRCEEPAERVKAAWL